MAIDKNKTINEHVDRLKYLSGYKINEAKYSLVDNLEEDDVVPDDVFKSPQPVSGVDSNVHEDEEDLEQPEAQADAVPAEEPAMDMGGEEEVAAAPEMGMEEPMAEPMPEPEQPSVEDIQNDILKKSVSAMEKMNSQLANLENIYNVLNQKIDTLGGEVEQVKEPTNVEKLEARKEDSHPFYMNMNDMWNGNTFQARQQVEDSYGMRKLDDGTYVADFDKLPKYNEQEIKDSF
jgi:hypothetical protein